MSKKLKIWIITILALLLSTFISYLLYNTIGFELTALVGQLLGFLCLALHFKLRDYYDVY